MNRELVIEYTPVLIRAALIEDGRLCELHRERIQAKKQTDSLYYGRVESIRPSVGAAFVDIGEERNAFLPIREGAGFKCGDFILVQGTAVQAVNTKGLRISDRLNLAGKWLVLAPGGEGVHTSKKIRDPELCEALIRTVEPLCPRGCGFIVRTASSDVTEKALADEAQALRQLWLEIQERARGMVRPGLVYEPADLSTRLIRDVGSTVTRVVVNDREGARRMEQLRKQGWIDESASIEYFDEASQLMNDVFSLDAQVDKALKRRVWLDCGGYLVFDACEALTVVDVNSGKMMLGRDTEDTALRVNLEAAREVARQLRLRDIGGIIIVDYIDMKEAEHRELLLRVIREEAQRDRAQVHVGGLTRLGLVEMTRKRKGEQLDKALQTTCRVCDGSGRMLSAEEAAFRALRQVRRMLASGQRGPFLIRCAAPVAAALAGMRAPNEAHRVYASPEPVKPYERFEINQIDERTALPKGAALLKG